MERRKQSSSKKLVNVDRLSGLPDSILYHILSFLPTKFSAATSILARRWRFLWADVPNIDLEFHPRLKWNKEHPQTSDIVNRILLGHNLKALNTFRLVNMISNVKENLTWHQLETWIAAVIARGKVQNIELKFRYCMKLPECLFTYKSLVDLRLHNCEIIISVPVSISFPILRKLHLSSVKYNNDETFQHLISGCSLLEELAVDYIVPDDLVCCRISSPTLERLKIYFGFYMEDDWSYDFRLEISTPALRHLQVRDYISKYISAQALTSLIEANVDLYLERLIEDDVVYPGSVLEFLDRMSNVSFLKLQIDYKFSPSAFSISSSTVRFHNLTKLELSADWCFILKFLEIADNLQVLIIDSVSRYLKCWVEPQQVFTCLLSHLRSIVMKSFYLEESEYSLVRYFLKNAKVLTSMKICCRLHLDKKFDALQRISLFERGSEACKLDFN